MDRVAREDRVAHRVGVARSADLDGAVLPVPRTEAMMCAGSRLSPFGRLGPRRSVVDPTLLAPGVNLLCPSMATRGVSVIGSRGRARWRTVAPRVVRRARAARDRASFARAPGVDSRTRGSAARHDDFDPEEGFVVT